MAPFGGPPAGDLDRPLRFINAVCAVVHEQIVAHQGGISSSGHDRILFIWKFRNQEASDIRTLLDNELSDESQRAKIFSIYEKIASTGENTDKQELHKLRIMKKNNKINSELCELAVLAILNIIVAVRNQRRAATNETDTGQPFGHQSPLLSFVLHGGWAIEGGFGSFVKVDCGYLSPNTRVLNQLVALHDSYGTQLTLTHFLFNVIFSPYLRRKCVLIDRVRFPEFIQNYDIYTLNLQPEDPSRREVREERSPAPGSPEYRELDEVDKFEEAIRCDAQLC